MSDLISRKEVEKVIKDYFKLIIDNTDDDVDCVLDYNKQILRNINELPTAYDVDKVVEHIEDYGKWKGVLNCDSNTCDNYVPVRKVKAIIKAGWKE